MSSVTAPQVLFILFAALMLGSGIGVVSARNQVTAAMSLVASFFFLAAIYALLSAHVLAVLQVLVYAGAIVVLFLFVIMLLSLADPAPERFTVTPLHVGALAVAVAVIFAVTNSRWVGPDPVRIVKVEGRGPFYDVTFAQTIFHRSEYLAGPIGTAESARGASFEVMSVGEEGRTPVHTLRLISGTPPAAGDMVRMSWRAEEVAPSFGTIAELGDLLYTRYLLPFEITSLLLLVAIIGAVVVAKERV